MKQKVNYRLGLLTIAALCVAVIIVAGIKSSNFTAPVTPKPTQQQIAQKLYQSPRPESATSNGNNSSNKPIAKTVPTAPLVDTGAGDTIVLFLMVSFAGMFIAYVRQLRRLR